MTALTHRERQVIGMIIAAKQNKIIAFELGLSEGTIKEYIHRIFQKLHVSNRTELAVWGFRNPDSLAEPVFQDIGMVTLSREERQIIDFIRDGETNKAISFQLHWAEKSVQRSVSRLFKKTGVSQRKELAAWGDLHPASLEENRGWFSGYRV